MSINLLWNSSVSCWSIIQYSIRVKKAPWLLHISLWWNVEDECPKISGDPLPGYDCSCWTEPKEMRMGHSLWLQWGACENQLTCEFLLLTEHFFQPKVHLSFGWSVITFLVKTENGKTVKIETVTNGKTKQSYTVISLCPLIRPFPKYHVKVPNYCSPNFQDIL